MNLLQSNTPDSSSGDFANFYRLSLFCSILLPFLPFSMRKPLLLFTKFMELKECMNYVPEHAENFSDSAGNSNDRNSTIANILNRLSPFLSEKERAQFSQIQNMMQMMEFYQTMQELAPFMNMAPESESSTAKHSTEENFQEESASAAPENDTGNNMADALFSMLSPEQKEMFENLKSVMSEQSPE